MAYKANQITGVILAGGSGSRMGSSAKPLLTLGDKPIICHIIAAAHPQVNELIISANSHIESYQALATAVVQDAQSDYNGPMAGILSALHWITEHRSDSLYLACFPGDAPWFPQDIVEHMLRTLEGREADIAWVENDGQLQPLFSLWRISLLPSLAKAIEQGMYSPMAFIRSQNNCLLSLQHCESGHFDNLNFPEDLVKARADLDPITNRSN
jgi:molybdopterin-guanine dinucleotide biosynthesis protein A